MDLSNTLAILVISFLLNSICCRSYFDYMYYLYCQGDSDDYNCNEIYLYNQWIVEKSMYACVYACKHICFSLCVTQ